MNDYDGSVQFWKRGKVYYYRLPGEKTFHTTKQTNKALARSYVSRVMNEGKPNKSTLEQYARDFFVWNKCQWIIRQKANVITSYSIHYTKLYEVYPGVKVLAEQPADWDTVKAQSIAENWYTQFPELDAISGVTDAYLYPSLAIAENRGITKVTFWGYDGDIPILA